jgi:hypothetical protein
MEQVERHIVSNWVATGSWPKWLEATLSPFICFSDRNYIHKRIVIPYHSREIPRCGSPAVYALYYPHRHGIYHVEKYGVYLAINRNGGKDWLVS